MHLRGCIFVRSKPDETNNEKTDNSSKLSQETQEQQQLETTISKADSTQSQQNDAATDKIATDSDHIKPTSEEKVETETKTTTVATATNNTKTVTKSSNKAPEPTSKKKPSPPTAASKPATMASMWGGLWQKTRETINNAVTPNKPLKPIEKLQTKPKQANTTNKNNNVKKEENDTSNCDEKQANETITDSKNNIKISENKKETIAQGSNVQKTQKPQETNETNKDSNINDISNAKTTSNTSEKDETSQISSKTMDKADKVSPKPPQPPPPPKESKNSPSLKLTASAALKQKPRANVPQSAVPPPPAKREKLHLKTGETPEKASIEELNEKELNNGNKSNETQESVTRQTTQLQTESHVVTSSESLNKNEEEEHAEQQQQPQEMNEKVRKLLDSVSEQESELKHKKRLAEEKLAHIKETLSRATNVKMQLVQFNNSQDNNKKQKV